jgi:uncharacterized iron-regulated membrane protein
MLYESHFETKFGERYHIEVMGEKMAVNEQAEKALDIFTAGELVQYISPKSKSVASLFDIRADDVRHIVAVDPYSGTVLGTIKRNDSWYAFASDIHGTLLIGDIGDRLIEIAAGLAIVLLITGLYLWWPRSSRTLVDALRFKLSGKGRVFWKQLHASTGFYISIILMFFLLSGMAWTGVWGAKIVQPWNSFPAEKWGDIPLSDVTHAAMNAKASHDVPWNLEQTPMPESGSNKGVSGWPEGRKVEINAIVEYAEQLGYRGQYRVNFPSGEAGVFTLSADSMSGDTQTPTEDRTVHIDQYTGKILAEAKFADYNLIAKSLAVGTALHQGDLGLWNIILNTLFCLCIVFLCISGVVMWWMRRPANARTKMSLTAPPMPKNLPHWKGAIFTGLLVSLAFPLVGLVLLIGMAADMFISSRLTKASLPSN